MLNAQTSGPSRRKSQSPQSALVNIYEAVLSYLIRLACSKHGGNPISEPWVHQEFLGEIAEKERAFANRLDSWGPAVEKQLRRLFASAARGQPTYARNGAAAGSTQEAGYDNESTSSELLGGLFDQFPDSPDFRVTPGGFKKPLGAAYKWLVSMPQYIAFCDTSGTQSDVNQILWVIGAPGGRGVAPDAVRGQSKGGSE